MARVLVDTGNSVAARTVAALDKHLVIVGLSRYLRLFDPGTFEPTAESDDEPMDRNEMMNSETSGDVLEQYGREVVRHDLVAHRAFERSQLRDHTAFLLVGQLSR